MCRGLSLGSLLLPGQQGTASDPVNNTCTSTIVPPCIGVLSGHTEHVSDEDAAGSTMCGLALISLSRLTSTRRAILNMVSPAPELVPHPAGRAAIRNPSRWVDRRLAGRTYEPWVVFAGRHYRRYIWMPWTDRLKSSRDRPASRDEINFMV